MRHFSPKYCVLAEKAESAREGRRPIGTVLLWRNVNVGSVTSTWTCICSVAHVCSSEEFSGRHWVVALHANFEVSTSARSIQVKCSWARRKTVSNQSNMMGEMNIKIYWSIQHILVKWTSISNHVQNIHHGHLFHECEHDAIDRRIQNSEVNNVWNVKKWLKPGIDVFWWLYENIYIIRSGHF
jgi:hypothetical protein